MYLRTVGIAQRANVTNDPSYLFMLARLVENLRETYGDDIAKWILAPEPAEEDKI